MSGSRQTGRLVLAPETPARAAEPESLIRVLRDTGLIGVPLGNGQDPAFLVGDAFLQVITFMGCSPHVELTVPAGGGSFCHVRLHGPHPSPILMFGRNTRPPRCCACRKRVAEWTPQAQAWRRNPDMARVECPHCTRQQRPMDVLWRQDAGFGRSFVAIEDIFPGEAVPVPSLLQTLHRELGMPWRYFFLQD